jgi:very-short-patch-repair endonuclease
MRGPDRHSLPRARHLRKNTTPAEARLWEQLRGKQFERVKFSRQHPIGPYFADFAARSHGLIVEVDGATHSTDAELQKDAVRNAYLNSQGYRVLRVTNDEVLNGIDEVLTIIRDELQGSRPAPAGREWGPKR